MCFSASVSAHLPFGPIALSMGAPQNSVRTVTFRCACDLRSIRSATEKVLHDSFSPTSLSELLNEEDYVRFQNICSYL